MSFQQRRFSGGAANRAKMAQLWVWPHDILHLLGRNCRRQRNAGLDGGATAEGGLYGEFPAHAAQAFLHAEQANSRSGVKRSRIETSSRIRDSQVKHARDFLQLHYRYANAAVFVDIADCFL